MFRLYFCVRIIKFNVTGSLYSFCGERDHQTDCRAVERRQLRSARITRSADDRKEEPGDTRYVGNRQRRVAGNCDGRSPARSVRSPSRHGRPAPNRLRTDLLALG